MPDDIFTKAIEELKKYNIALTSVTYNRNQRVYLWDEAKLEKMEKEFNIKLTDEDKERLKKDKKTLKNEIAEKSFHLMIIEKIQEIFKSAEILNYSAELLGLLLRAFDITTSQIRRYLDSLRKIKYANEFKSGDVLLQQVKIAYAAGRNRDLIFFYMIMKPALIEGSKSEDSFKELLKFVEGIVAYHRYYGGGD